MKTTSNTLEKLKMKIVHSRARILQRSPAFGLLLMHVNFVVDNTLSTASVNAKSMFFNAHFLENLREEETDFLLCHLLMHILKKDIWRFSDWEGASYHHACNIVNNAALRDIGFAEERYGHLGKIYWRFGLSNVSGRYYSPLQVVSTFLVNIEKLSTREQRQFLFDTDSKWTTTEAVGTNGMLLLDGDDFYQTEEFTAVDELTALSRANDGDEATGEDESFALSEQEQWEWRVATILQNDVTGNGAGKSPLGEVLRVQELKKSQVDWKRILNEFLREEIADYSFTPPDRRFDGEGFFLPDFNETDYAPTDALFMVDTSGSINEENLTLAYSEMKGAVEQFAGKLTGKLGFFDAEVQKVVDFSSVRDIVRETPVGGGGTDFYSVFRYLDERYPRQKPAFIVIFTDGYAEFPPESSARGVPVLWLVNNEDVEVPWGKVSRVVSRRNTF